jgi:hypothetical protein
MLLMLSLALAQDDAAARGKQSFGKCADWWTWWKDNKAKFKVED